MNYIEQTFVKLSELVLKPHIFFRNSKEITIRNVILLIVAANIFMLISLMPNFYKLLETTLFSMKLSTDLLIIFIFFAILFHVFCTLINLLINTYFVYWLLKLQRMEGISFPSVLSIVTLIHIPLAIRSIVIGIRLVFQPGYIPDFKLIDVTGTINYWLLLDPFVLWMHVLLVFALTSMYRQSVMRSILSGVTLYVINLLINGAVSFGF